VNVQTLTEKLSKFAALHPQVVMYGISIGVTLGIALAVSFAMSPHDAFASGNSRAQTNKV
jgi:hypothetical protein